MPYLEVPGIKSKKIVLLNFVVTTCKTMNKWQEESCFTTSVPVDPKIIAKTEKITHQTQRGWMRYLGSGIRSQHRAGETKLSAIYKYRLSGGVRSDILSSIQ